jgi:hypothetical protein
MAKRSLLNNVKLLYFVFFLSLINLMYFVFNKDSQSIFLFAIIALIVSIFNKNMIIVLLITMVLLNVLIVMNSIGKEGFVKDETKDEKDKDIPKISSIPKLDKLDKLNTLENVDKLEKVEEIDESNNLLKPKLKKTNYPQTEDDINQNIKNLLPLTDALSGLDMNQINRMINNLNDIIEKF